MESRRSGLSFLLSVRGLLILALWLASMAGAALAGAYAYRGRAQIRALISSVQGAPMIGTNLYNLSMEMLSIPSDGRDGGIAPVGEGILFANRVGDMWYVDRDLTLAQLSTRVPVNVNEFEQDPQNAGAVSRDLFGVKDVFVRTQGERLDVFVSHNQWFADRDCYLLRVSRLQTTLEDLQGGEGGPHSWETFFETTPCLPLVQNQNGTIQPTLGAGGRMAALSDSEMLLTVGEFAPEALSTADDHGPLIDDDTYSYGKTILLDVASGASRVYSVGHRNPQGLAVASTGEIWLSEHGPRGGDELNRILDDKNYGFPFVTYGTAYESMEWPLNPLQGRHEGYEKPTFAWVPSVGTSQVLVVESPLFVHWHGDVLVSSLTAQTLFRVRVEDARAVLVEPIRIGHGIRDVVERSDGVLVLKTDDDFLVFIRPLTQDAASMAALDAPERGRVLATNCAGCHAVSDGAPDGIGPNLWRVVDREVAARDGYAYSQALSSLGGQWSADRLRAFLENPNAFAPGTSMAIATSYNESEIADLVAYLETLR